MGTFWRVFADDIATPREEIHPAQEKLASVELEAAKLGLHLNSKTTEVMHFMVYGNLPPVSSKVGFRRLKLAGHCVTHPEEEASKLLTNVQCWPQDPYFPFSYLVPHFSEVWKCGKV